MSTHPYALQRDDRSRIDWLDYAKGIGIILVVYGHVISGLSNAGVLQTISIEAKQALDLSVQAVYLFHMPLFFFLSGLLFKDQHLTTDRQRWMFAGKKIIGLMYPYLIWSIIFSVVMIAFSDKTNLVKVSWSDIPYQIVFDPKSHMWFLYAICLINLIVLGLKKFLPIWLILSLSMALQFGAANTSGILSAVMSSMFFFVLGHGLSKTVLQPKWALKPYHYVLLSLVGVGVYSIGVTVLLPNFAPSQGLPTAISIAFALLGILMTSLLSYGIVQVKPLNWLKVLGENSLYIYILHMLTWVAVRVLLLKVFKTDQFSIHFVLAMLAGLLPPIVLGQLALRYAPWIFSANGIIKALKRPKSLPL